MRRHCTAILAICLMAAAVSVAYLADPGLPLSHWAYAAMAQLQEADLLPEYPSEWVAAGHPLTRHEIAFYLRNVLLRLGRQNDEDERSDSVTTLTSPVESTLSGLVEEFSPELKALGVNVEPWSNQGEAPAFVDLDSLLSSISSRPEAPPANPPPGPSDGSPQGVLPPYQIELADSGTYNPAQVSTLSIPLTDFGSRSDYLIGLAGEVLGVDWALGLGTRSDQETLGGPLRIGGFAITDEKAGIQGGLGVRLGDDIGVGFDALWFLDLDQAQMAMNRLLLDVNTGVELNERLGLFGGLSLEYHGLTYLPMEVDSRASAGFWFMVGDDLYLIAQYSLSNPFSGSLPHRSVTTLGLSLRDVGLLLLGFQTIGLDDPEELKLTGEFIYRF